MEPKFNYKFKDNVSLGQRHLKYNIFQFKRKKEEVDVIISDSKVDIPTKLDYRHLITSVLYQDTLPCGTSNTIIAAGNLLHCLINENRWFYKLDTKIMSRLYNYWNAKIIEKGDLYDGTPIMIESGLSALESKAVCPEDLFQYSLENLNVCPPLEAYNYAGLYNHKIGYCILDNNINVIKSELYNKHPVMLGIILFDSYNKSDNGLILIPDISSEKIIGSHTILLVGYNNDKKYFIFQNSLGQSYGHKGFGYIEYEYILNQDICGDVYSIY